MLYCKGYRPKGAGHHYTVFQAIKEILGKDYCDLVDYFDACRAKRHVTDYDYAGTTSTAEVREIIKEAEEFLDIVLDWLKKHYPKYTDER